MSILKEKSQVIRYSEKGDRRSRSLEADIRAEQVSVFENGRKGKTLPSGNLRRRVEIINGKKFYVYN